MQNRVKDAQSDTRRVAYQNISSLCNGRKTTNLVDWLLSEEAQLFHVKFSDPNFAVPQYNVIIEDNLCFTIVIFNWILPVTHSIYGDDIIDPMCSVNDGVEDVTHYLLSCHLYTHDSIELLNSVSRITETNVSDLEKEALVKLLLYGNEKKYSFDKNRKILLCTIIFIKNSNRF